MAIIIKQRDDEMTFHAQVAKRKILETHIKWIAGVEIGKFGKITHLCPRFRYHAVVYFNHCVWVNNGYVLRGTVFSQWAYKKRENNGKKRLKQTW